jgi:hypothetical protein
MHEDDVYSVPESDEEGADLQEQQQYSSGAGQQALDEADARVNDEAVEEAAAAGGGGATISLKGVTLTQAQVRWRCALRLGWWLVS